MGLLQSVERFASMSTLTGLGSRYLDSLRLLGKKTLNSELNLVFILVRFSVLLNYLDVLISTCILYMIFDFFLATFLPKLSKNFLSFFSELPSIFFPNIFLT